MELSRRQLEFYGYLILLCTITAALILLIDFQIKGAILEESNRLRRAIEQEATRTASRRSSDNDHNDPGYPADLVPSGNARLETPGNIQGGNGKAPASRTRRAKPKGLDGPGSVPDRSE